MSTDPPDGASLTPGGGKRKYARCDLWDNTIDNMNRLMLREGDPVWDEKHDVELCPCPACRCQAAALIVDSCPNVRACRIGKSGDLQFRVNEKFTLSEYDAMHLMVEEMEKIGRPVRITLIRPGGKATDLVARYRALRDRR